VTSKADVKDGGRRRRPAPVAAALLFVVFTGCFAYLAWSQSAGGGIAAHDAAVLSFLASHRTRAGIDLFWFFTLLGNTLVMSFLAATVVGLLLLWGKRNEAVLIAIALGVGWGIESGLKTAFHRIRPPALDAMIHTPVSQSFPSGHAFVSVTLAAVLVFLAFRSRFAGSSRGRGRSFVSRGGVASLAVLGSCAVAFSRLYLGVHWLTDVLGSWALAGAWLALAIGLFLRWTRSGIAIRPGRAPARQRWKLAAVVIAVVVVGAVLTVESFRDPVLSGFGVTEVRAGHVQACRLPLSIPCMDLTPSG
jgi:membrane-associated phospholipid phosphatase